MDADSDTLLIQFARAPVAGQVKTRMIPRLSASEACELHCELVLWTCRTLLNCGLGRVQLAVAGDSSAALFLRCQELGPLQLTQQRGEDLGERMFHAIDDALCCHSRVLLLGSDCPAIDRSYLQQARAALDAAPVVLGPATDGGYVLIGAREVRRDLFEGIAWGSERVFAQTVAAIERAGLTWYQLPVMADIDRPEDLAGWRQLRLTGAASGDTG